MVEITSDATNSDHFNPGAAAHSRGRATEDVLTSDAGIWQPNARAKQPNSWRMGNQPILVTAAALALVILGIGGVFAWRSYSGTTPEPERLTAARLTQARVAQASEQLVEKTKGIEATQQQSIDQLQVVQDQLQTVQRLLASQQNETRKLNEQVANLTGTLDTLRQSFASAPPPEASPAAATRERPKRGRARVTVTSGKSKGVVQRKRAVINTRS